MNENQALEMPLEDFATAVAKENQRLRDILYNSGIVEIAAHNNRVTEYMFHWEGRVLDAEANVERLLSTLRAVLAVTERHDNPTMNVISDNIRLALEGK